MLHVGRAASRSALAIGLAINLLAAVMVSPALAAGDRFDKPYGSRNATTARKNPSTILPARQKTSPKESETKQPVIPPGPLHVIVSVASQRVTVFSGGVAVAQAPVSTGTASHPTPLGIFAIITKNKWHRSNIYSDAPMPYMQRLTWSGIALHAGALPGYPASHGCIRLPGAFAIRLWSMTRLGARVIVTRDPVSPVEIVHPRLFVPKKPDELVTAPAVAVLPEPVKTAATTKIAQIGNDANVVAAAGQKEAAATNAMAETKPEIVLRGALEVAAPVAAPKRKGPVQVFVSRRDAKVYVRQGFAPLFESPITIAEPQKPWGTHVFTAMEIKDAAVRWTVVSIPSGYGRKLDRDRRASSAVEPAREKKAVAESLPKAERVLERFDLPPDAISRISGLLAPGSALIVSDNPLSDETGSETDFVVLTP